MGGSRLGSVLVAAWVCAVVVSVWGPMRADGQGTMEGGPGPPVEATEGQPGVTGPSTVTLNFGDEVDIRLIVDYVAARTGRNFIYDETLIGTVALRAPQEVPSDALYGVLQTILEFKGWALVPAPRGFVKVVPAPVAALKPSPFYGPDEVDELPDDDVIVTQVVELEFADPAALLQALVPIVSGTGVPYVAGPRGRGAAAATAQAVAAGPKLLAVPEHRLLVITDYAPNVRRVVKLVEMLDREARREPARREVFRLEHARAEQYAPRILSYLQAQHSLSGEADEAAALVDCDPRLNSVIVVGTAEDVETVRELIESFDVPVPETETPYRILWLKNSRAEQMLETVEQVMTARAEATSGSAEAPGASGGLQQSPGDAAGTGVHVVANKHTNSIILLGPPKEVEVLATVVGHLDRRRPQVTIEALVVEVDADKTFDVGTELANLQEFAGDKVGGATSFGLSEIDFTEGTVEIEPARGLTGFLILDGDVRAIIRLFEQKVQGKIVSHPRALVNDNESAVFRSEREEPFVQISTLGADTTTVSFGGYENAGTTLSITPHISEADYLQLEIELELSAFQGEGALDAPPPRTRSTVSSRVTVPDNATVLLGGLNRTDERQTISRVPILGSIPILGYLFRRKTTVRSDATLYVFIKANIARQEDFSDLKASSEEASRQLLRQENLTRSESRRLPEGQDVFESPAFRPGAGRER
jgi:general secretion pathway protein D